MFLVPFPMTVWKFRILPRSAYLGALGGLTCSKVFGSIPLAISAASTRNLTSSLSQSLKAVTDFSLPRSFNATSGCNSLVDDQATSLPLDYEEFHLPALRLFLLPVA